MNTLTQERLDTWATDPKGPVALCLKQRLLPVQGEGGVIFPPTYADIGYNIDVLSDGTRVATIDSVGSQANRMEPIFKALPDGQSENLLADLIPQIKIVLNTNGNGKTAHFERHSILDLAHRSADAVVQSSPTLVESVTAAFEALKRTGNAGPLCALAPTSLVFGVWDSRGTGEKRPRLVRAVVRAWNVEPLHAAAQFNSVWKALSEEQKVQLENEAKKQKRELSEKGFKDAPATFRKTKNIPNFLRDGTPNPQSRVLGGVHVNGRIEREVTVNLIALRGLHGKDAEETRHVRRYLLGLSLLAATAEIDLFLREGCHLRYGSEDQWLEVPRRDDPQPVDLCSSGAQALLLKFASAAASYFKPGWPQTLEHQFDLAAAKQLLARRTQEDNLGEE